VAQLGARLDGIEEVVGSNPIGSTNHKPRQRFSLSNSRQVRVPQTYLSVPLAPQTLSICARRSLRDEFAVLSLDHFESADAASNVDANPLSIFRCNMNRCLSRSVAGSCHRELDEAPHFLHVLPVDEVFR
jgi:hypothetical protein